MRPKSPRIAATFCPTNVLLEAPAGTDAETTAGAVTPVGVPGAGAGVAIGGDSGAALIRPAVPPGALDATGHKGSGSELHAPRARPASRRTAETRVSTIGKVPLSV